MAIRSEEFFHDKWLGMVQTESDGLVVAKPVLIEAGCANTQSPEVQDKLRELCPPRPNSEPRRILDLMQLFQQLLDFDTNLFEKTPDIADEVSLYAPEGPQTIRPSFGLVRQDEPEPPKGTGSPAANAARKYAALIWDVTVIDDEINADAIGLSLDKPETITGPWSYPAAAKFDRLLRHCQVPVGILTNREVIRLVYAPHGESSGHITFRIEDMATVGGRPILDAMIMLLCANQWFGVSKENALPSLLRRSREYQGTVTDDLAEQVFSGLETLLKGFQTAAERDKSGLLRDALERDKDHLYRGLLTVMLRLVFVLYAEDRNLLPVDHPLYANHMSLIGLFERLQRDHGNYPDSMNNRFSAWGCIISLSRAIYLGVEHGEFHIPARQGDLFDPHRYSFLEGWTGEGAPIVSQSARAEVRVPTIDDGTVFALLSSLLIFQGQRLSYRTLDVEQIGSVYEALMGYQVSACQSRAVAIKLKNKRGSPKYWLEADAVMSRPVGQRVKWLKDECGFETQVATKIQVALEAVAKEKPGDQNAAIEALLPLIAGKKGNTHEQQARIGQYVLQPGSERRRSGTQYTPRSLTQPIVHKTLEPLIQCLGDSPKASQLLDLKLCDPAMGSGAFLVECCRQLADEIVAAWGRAHEVELISACCANGDVVAHARRLVAQRCLYGVDKNAMAVQLAKLSLWLFTLARELPFTFLDHNLRHGDSLVGLDLEQIKAFHWKPQKQLSFLDVEISRALEEVVVIRQEIHQLADDSTPEGQKRKAQRLFDASDATEKVRRVADVCVGAFFAMEKEKGRLAERQLREEQVRAWLGGDVGAGKAVEQWVTEIRDCHAPFHWWLEFPEVFYDKRPDPLEQYEVDGAAFMEAFVGNPPFIGGARLSTAQGGPAYQEWLKANYTGTFGNADLCAYFFRRAFDLVGSHGAIGFLATNTISEGDTRTSGLRHIILSGGQIYDAHISFNWPGAAAVVVTSVHIALGRLVDAGLHRTLDNQTVDTINSRLLAMPEREEPTDLGSNLQFGFEGTYLNAGFILDSDEYEELASRGLNAERLFPKLGGQEVNTSPTQSHSQYAINFGSMELVDAARWPELLEIVRERVRPQRLMAKDHGPGAHGKKYWWQHLLRADPLYANIRTLSRCIVAARTTTHLVLSFQPIAQVFANTVVVFAFEEYTQFAVLQSRVHEVWARLVSSTLGVGLRYSVGSCFGTFPFPDANPRKVFPEIEHAGEALYKARAQLMIDTDQGLTTIYNLLKNSDCDDMRVLRLRHQHEEMERAVLGAYGWTDIEVPPFCPMNDEDQSSVNAYNAVVINRLYDLNALRAADEKLQAQNSMRKTEKLVSSRSKKFAEVNMSLPGMSDGGSTS
jgi:N-6 DNA Methylase